MFASQGVSRRRFFWASAVFCALLFAPLKIQATPPTGATARCQVILNYEGVCGNYRPNNCFSRPGFDYWGNSEHQQIWDAYQELCVLNTTPSENRYSHECISYYGLGSTCTSTVEDLVEYHAVTELHATYTVRSEPQYTAVSSGSYVAYYCGLTTETRGKIDAFYAACGDVAPGSCSASGSIVSNFTGICGDKKPCQCFQNLHCSSSYCVASPVPATPPVALGDGSDGSGGSGGGTDPGGSGGSGGSDGGGAGTGGAPDVAFSAPIGDQGTGGSGSPSNNAASGGGGKSGCALGNSAEDSGRGLSWALLSLWIALLGGMRLCLFDDIISKRCYFIFNN